MVRNGGTLNRELSLINGASYSVPAAALAALAADPEVAYISPERPVFTTNNGSPTAVLDYHTEAVNASTAWATVPPDRFLVPRPRVRQRGPKPYDQFRPSRPGKSGN